MLSVSVTPTQQKMLQCYPSFSGRLSCSLTILCKTLAELRLFHTMYNTLDFTFRGVKEGGIFKTI